MENEIRELDLFPEVQVYKVTFKDGKKKVTKKVAASNEDLARQIIKLQHENLKDGDILIEETKTSVTMSIRNIAGMCREYATRYDYITTALMGIMPLHPVGEIKTDEDIQKAAAHSTMALLYSLPSKDGAVNKHLGMAMAVLALETLTRQFLTQEGSEPSKEDVWKLINKYANLE